MRAVNSSIEIHVKPSEVINAFVEPHALQEWWGVQRSLIEARPGGSYILAWDISKAGMKYITSGIIQELIPDAYLLIGNMVYLNAEKEILGPMELEIKVAVSGGHKSRITVHQSGYQDGGDWDWYYDAVTSAWPLALEALRNYLENSD